MPALSKSNGALEGRLLRPRPLLCYGLPVVRIVPGPRCRNLLLLLHVISPFNCLLCVKMYDLLDEGVPCCSLGESVKPPKCAENGLTSISCIEKKKLKSSSLFYSQSSCSCSVDTSCLSLLSGMFGHLASYRSRCGGASSDGFINEALFTSSHTLHRGGEKHGSLKVTPAGILSAQPARPPATIPHACSVAPLRTLPVLQAANFRAAASWSTPAPPPRPASPKPPHVRRWAGDSMLP